MKTLHTCLAALLVSTGAALAETEAFNLSLTPDIAVYSRTCTVEGMTLSLWGENQQDSFALGLVNGTKGQSSGLSLGLMNYADSYTGCQWGLANYVSKDFKGWQGGPFFGLVVSVVNCTEGTMTGFQSGLVNYAGRLTGLQLGVVNYAKAADSGLQIGIVNIIEQNTAWFSDLPGELAPGMILVNWRF